AAGWIFPKRLVSSDKEQDARYQQQSGGAADGDRPLSPRSANGRQRAPQRRTLHVRRHRPPRKSNNTIHRHESYRRLAMGRSVRRWAQELALSQLFTPSKKRRAASIGS